MNLIENIFFLSFFLPHTEILKYYLHTFKFYSLFALQKEAININDVELF